MIEESLWQKLPRLLPPSLWQGVVAAQQVAATFPGQAWLVGGVVRDALWGLPPHDVDIAVEGDGEAFARQVAASLNGKVAAFAQFLTYKVFWPEGELNVATLRQEHYASPGALPEVSPGNLRQDSLRRDFTLNAIYLSLAPNHLGELVDQVQGLSHLQAGILCTLTPDSFCDDATRILRGIRFAGQYPCRFDAITWQQACQAVADGMFNTISGNRIWQELQQMLASRQFANMAKSLTEVGFWFECPAALQDSETVMALVPDSQRVLLNLLLFTAMLAPEARAELATLWQIPAAYQKALIKATFALPQNPLSLGAWHDRYAGHCQEEVLGAALLGGGDYVAPAIAYLARRKIKPLLKGKDLQKMGFAPGPLYHELLQALVREKISGGLPKRQDEEAFIQHLGARKQKEETHV